MGGHASWRVERAEGVDFLIDRLPELLAYAQSDPRGLKCAGQLRYLAWRTKTQDKSWLSSVRLWLAVHQSSKASVLHSQFEKQSVGCLLVEFSVESEGRRRSVCCYASDDEALRAVLLHEDFRWDIPSSFAGCALNIRTLYDEVVHKKVAPGTAFWSEDCFLYYFDQSDEMKVQKASDKLSNFLLENPQYKLRPLTREHALLVNSTWKYGSEETMERTYRLIDNYPTIALYVNDKPVSWCLLQDYEGLGMTYTTEEYRRKGLGKVIAWAMVKELTRENRPIFCFIVTDNSASLRMYESAGFERVGRVDWFGYYQEAEEESSKDITEENAKSVTDEPAGATHSAVEASQSSGVPEVVVPSEGEIVSGNGEEEEES